MRKNTALALGLPALAFVLALLLNPSPERHRDINPLRSLIEAGVKVSLATDNVPVSPFLPIAQAIVRETFGGGARVAPGEGLGRADALRCATGSGAWLTFDEGCKGSLEPGKLADLAVLSADPLAVEEGDIARIREMRRAAEDERWEQQAELNTKLLRLSDELLRSAPRSRRRPLSRRSSDTPRRR